MKKKQSILWKFLPLLWALFMLVMPVSCKESFQEDDIVNDSSLNRSSGFDTRLVGSWTHTEFYNSGSFSSVTKQTMIYRQNGQMELYEPVTFVSGSGVGIRDTTKKLQAVISVATKNGKLFVVHPDTGEEFFVTNYTIAGDSMLFSYDDGSNKLWKKTKL